MTRHHHCHIVHAHRLDDISELDSSSDVRPLLISLPLILKFNRGASIDLHEISLHRATFCLTIFGLGRVGAQLHRFMQKSCVDALPDPF